MVPPPQVRVQLLQGLHLGGKKHRDFEGHECHGCPLQNWLLRLCWQAAHPTCNPPDRLAFASGLRGSRIGVQAKRCSMPWEYHKRSTHTTQSFLCPVSSCNYSNCEPRWPGCGNYINTDFSHASLLHSNHYHIHGKNWPSIACLTGYKPTLPSEFPFFSGPGHVLQWSSSLVSPTHGSPPLAWGVTSTDDVNLSMFFVLQNPHVHPACRRCIVCSPSCYRSTACSHSPTTSLWGKQWGGWHLRIHGCVSDFLAN